MFKSLIFTILISQGAMATEATIGPAPAPEDRIKIAVVDTGFETSKKLQPFLCRQGHISFTNDSPFSEGHSGKHGTNVAGLIAESLDSKKHCLLIIKFYSEYLSEKEFKDYVRMGIEYAISQNAKYLNLSLGGPESSHLEFLSLQAALNTGMKIIVAAGNGKKVKGSNIGQNLDKDCYYYPACYKFRSRPENFFVVGSTQSKFSNYGKVVTRWADGNYVGVPAQSGTSQATAIVTGQIVKEDTK